MIYGIGVDIVDVHRFDNVTIKFLERVFTPSEIEYASRAASPSQRYAVRFAAKEAFLKAIGTGLRDCTFQDMEVYHDHLGKPFLKLHGRLAVFSHIEQYRVHLSLSHTAQQAIAYCVVESITTPLS